MPYVPLKPLKPDDEREIPGFGVCDIEAKDWINFLVIGYAFKTYDKKTDTEEDRQYHYFLNLHEFCDYVFEDRNPHNVIFAHFGGKYDYSFILKEYFFDHENYHIHEMIPRGSGLLSFKVSSFERHEVVPKGTDEKDILRKTSDGAWLIAKRTIEFRDSSAFLPFGLASLTENFGVDHKKKEMDYESITCVTDELLEYLEYDCWGLYECIERYFRWPMIRRSGPAYTIASQSLKVFRTFMKNPIPSLSDDNDKFVRRSYFGGRTEIFKPFFEQKKDDVMLRSYDVNSLYPFIMKSLSFPGKFKKDTLIYQENQMGFYDVEVTVPDMYVPPLGARLESMDWRLIFPTGTFRGVFSTLELNYAMSLGVKLNRVYEGKLFHDYGPIFQEYIEVLYDMRKRAKKGSVDDVLTKLIMNSTYGRFGLNLDREQLVFDQGQLGLEPHMDIQVSENRIIRLGKIEANLETSFANVAIAAWVTSGSRIHMHRLYEQAPEDLYYTDSVTRERMVMVKSKRGNISVKSMDELWAVAQNVKPKGSKEVGDLDFETLSFNPKTQSWEWRKIEKIIRHDTTKKIVLTRSNLGASRTTEDHSFIDEQNKKLKPDELKKLFSPKLLSVPRGTILESIDLLDYIENREDLAWNRDFIWATHSKSKRRQDYKHIKLKRIYTGEDLKDFCALAGYFVSEGSTSTKKRHMFSISSEKIEFQEYLRTFLNKSLDGGRVGHIKSSSKDNCMALRAGNKTMALIFSRLFGQGSKNKKLPDFVFNLNQESEDALLNALILGDGSRTTDNKFSKKYRDKNYSYSSQSFVLMNQLCGLLSFRGQGYSIQYRPSKHCWAIQTSDLNRIKKPRISTQDYEGPVFDLQVEGNNNFFDCEGMIGLHNTDSIKTTHRYPQNDADLGQLKLEYKSKRAAFLLPKTYMEDTNSPIFKLFNEAGKERKDIKTASKIVMKGFDKKKISGFKFDDFLSALEGDMRRMRATNPKKFATLRTAVSKNEFLYLLEEAPRQIRTRYNKRRVFKRAWSQVYDTEPLHIQGGEVKNLDQDIMKKWKMPSEDQMRAIMDETLNEMGLNL